MQELEILIASGDYRQILDTSLTWHDKQIRAARKWLAAYWKEHKNEIDKGVVVRAGPVHENVRLWMRIVIANIAIAKDAKSALAIPLPHDPGVRHIYYVSNIEKAALLEAIARRGREWTADYVTLATDDKKAWLMNPEVIIALLIGFKLPWPDNDEFYNTWALLFSNIIRHERSEPLGLELPRIALQVDADGAIQIEADAVKADSRIEAARTLVALDRLLANLLARRDGIIRLLERYYKMPDSFQNCAQVLKALMDERQIDRDKFIEGTVQALVHGNAANTQRFLAVLLETANLSTDEIQSYAATLHGLLSSGHGSVAKVAQALLQQMDKEVALDDELFNVACEMVFARLEKGLRNEQLKWASQRIKKKRSTNPEGLFAALQVEDLSFQQKAVQAILETPELDKRYMAQYQARFEMAKPVLPADLQVKIAGLLGEESETPAVSTDTAGAEAEQLTPTSPVLPFQPIEPELAECNQLLADLGAKPSVNNTEQLIQLSMTLAQQGRLTLQKALQQIYRSFDLDLPHVLQEAAYGKWDNNDLQERQASLLSGQGRNWREDPSKWDDACAINMLKAVAWMRYYEIAAALQNETPYPCISLPSYTHGAIEGDEFVQRMGRLDKDGLQAGPMDLCLALMRSTHPGEQGIRTLRAMKSPQAHIAADFLAAGGMNQLGTAWHVVSAEEVPSQNGRSTQFNVQHGKAADVYVSMQGLNVLPAIDDIPVRWSESFTPATAPGYWEFGLVEPLLAGVLPNHGEILFALNLWGFRKACSDSNADGGKAAALALPAFLTARGPAGPATHLALLFSLSANDASARLASSDGLLELIAQGRYDAKLAATLTAACIECGSIKIGRLAKSLAEVVAAGATYPIWPMLHAAITTALTLSPVPTGTADLLALTSQVVSTLGIREPIPILDTVASGKGRSKLLLEARRLQHLLKP